MGNAMGRRASRIGNLFDRVAKWLLRFRIFSIPARALANSKLAWSLISRVDRIRVRRLKDRIKNSPIPSHISIIMDGNRRFAWNKRLGSDFGHKLGKEKLKEVMDWILDLGVKHLTVYALSTEKILLHVLLVFSFENNHQTIMRCFFTKKVSLNFLLVFRAENKCQTIMRYFSTEKMSLNFLLV